MKKLITLFALSLLLNSTTWAQPGSLDATFDTDGIAQLSPGTLHDVAYAIDLQGDQKIVFTGVTRISSSLPYIFDLVVGRLNADGSLDETFATNGIYSLASAGGSVFGYDLKIQPDGKIVICGGYSVTEENSDFIVLRLNSDGTPDVTFGEGDGISIIPVASGLDYAYELEFLPGGEILLAGSASELGFSFNSGIVMRLLGDGTLDASFGNAGFTSLQLSSVSSESFTCMEVLNSGKIVTAGLSTVDMDNLLVAAFNADGTPDLTFATNGVHTGTSMSQAFDMVSDGSALYLSGRISSTSGFDMVISSFDTSGIINASFGTGGSVVATYNPIDAALGITLQPDGKILCVGASGQGMFGNRDMLVARYLPTGAIDPTFAGTGYAIIPASPNFEEASAVALQSDGKIVLAGFASFTDNDIVFMRLNNELESGISFSEEESDITIYPVPMTEGTLWIQTTEGFGSTALVELFDMRGTLIATKAANMRGSLIEFPIPPYLASGAYMLRVSSERRVISRMVVR